MAETERLPIDAPRAARLGVTGPPTPFRGPASGACPVGSGVGPEPADGHIAPARLPRAAYFVIGLTVVVVPAAAAWAAMAAFLMG